MQIFYLELGRLYSHAAHAYLMVQLMCFLMAPNNLLSEANAESLRRLHFCHFCKLKRKIFISELTTDCRAVNRGYDDLHTICAQPVRE